MAKKSWSVCPWQVFQANASTYQSGAPYSVQLGQPPPLFTNSLLNLPETNTLAYYPPQSARMKNNFMNSTPKQQQIQSFKN